MLSLKYFQNIKIMINEQTKYCDSNELKDHKMEKDYKKNIENMINFRIRIKIRNMVRIILRIKVKLK